MGAASVFPLAPEARALRRFAIVVAKVVFPDPGMPLMAMRKRSVEGVSWNLAVLDVQPRLRRVLWRGRSKESITPNFLH